MPSIALGVTRAIRLLALASLLGLAAACDDDPAEASPEPTFTQVGFVFVPNGGGQGQMVQVPREGGSPATITVPAPGGTLTVHYLTAGSSPDPIITNIWPAEYETRALLPAQPLATFV